jgi:hypothetical protein
MIAAIMPCRGRAEQTVRNVRRLLATAGAVEWRLTIVVDGDPDLFASFAQHELPIDVIASVVWSTKPPTQRVGYWGALKAGSEWLNNTRAPLLVNLANDLLPGQHWLQRAEAAYRATFGDEPGLMGFNDGHHETDHSCHFLISRALLDRYGGWPVWYDHNYGDTELCQRAIADGVYAKAPWATLFHDHVYFGGDDDSVYAEGRAQAERDRQLYEQRRAAGWPSV